MNSADKINRPQLAAALEIQRQLSEFRATLHKIIADSVGQRKMAEIRNSIAQISQAFAPLQEMRRTMQTQIALANTLLRSRSPSAIVTQTLGTQMLNPMPAKLASLRDAFQPFIRALTESRAQTDAMKSLPNFRTMLGKIAQGLPKLSLSQATQRMAGTAGAAAMQKYHQELARERTHAPGNGKPSSCAQNGAVNPYFHLAKGLGVVGCKVNNPPQGYTEEDRRYDRIMLARILACLERMQSTPPIATWGE